MKSDVILQAVLEGKESEIEEITPLGRLMCDTMTKIMRSTLGLSLGVDQRKSLLVSLATGYIAGVCDATILVRRGILEGKDPTENIRDDVLEGGITMGHFLGSPVEVEP